LGTEDSHNTEHKNERKKFEEGRLRLILQAVGTLAIPSRKLAKC